MKKFIYKGFVLAALSLSLTGCDEFLTHEQEG